MNTCGTCKHFGGPVERLSRWSSSECDFVESKLHVCQLIQHMKAHKPAALTAPAGVVDGSDYYAAFCVSEEFGCNQWAAPGDA
jgi:hypothetical protein